VRGQFPKNTYFLHMNVAKIYHNEAQFLAITSLSTEEFDQLLRPFAHAWQQWYKHYNFRMQRRRKPLSATAAQNSTRTLPSEMDKLFFILYIFKNNPLQQLAAATFDMDQGQVNKWIKILMPALEAAIKELHLQPARDMDELVRLFRQRPGPPGGQNPQAQTLNLDATERPTGRSTDNEAQKHDYSGKQKQHTAKNSVLCDEYQFIHFLGFTWRGAIHDKAMAEQELPALERLPAQDVWMVKDTGYQSYCPEGVILLEHFKAKRGHPLSKLQKQINTWVSSIRVTVEHAIGGVKRLRLVSEKWRGKAHGRIDKAMAIAAGLHNLRTVSRVVDHTCTQERTKARLEIFRS
jgi:hypothetical protein